MENKKIITLAQLTKYDGLLKTYIENKGYATVGQVEGLITAEQTRVNGEISRVEGLVNTEVSARQGEITRVEGLITKEVSDRKVEISRVEGLVGEVSEGVKDLTEVANGHDDRISTIEGMVGLGGQGNTSLTTRVSTLEGEMDVVEGKVSTLEGQVSTLEGRYTDARVDELIAAGVAEAKGYTYSQTEIDSKISTVNSTMGEYVDGQISALEGRVAAGYDVKGAAATAESNAKLYASEQVSALKTELLGEGATEALDTIAELAEALEDHKDAYDSLLTVVGGKATTEYVNAELAKKVDKEGYIAFTQAEKDKLAGIEAGANKYVLPSDVVQDGNYKHITVTGTSVSDGVNTFNKYDDTALAGRVSKVEGDITSTSQNLTNYIDEEIAAEVVRADKAYDVIGAADKAYEDAVSYVNGKFNGIVYASDSEVEALFA